MGKAEGGKAGAGGTAADLDLPEGETTEPEKPKKVGKPKRPTGGFVATTPLQLWDPKGNEGKGRRVVIGEGKKIPAFVTEAELAYYQDNGSIDHEYA